LSAEPSRAEDKGEYEGQPHAAAKINGNGAVWVGFLFTRGLRFALGQAEGEGFGFLRIVGIVSFALLRRHP